MPPTPKGGRKSERSQSRGTKNGDWLTRVSIENSRVNGNVLEAVAGVVWVC